MMAFSGSDVVKSLLFALSLNLTSLVLAFCLLTLLILFLNYQPIQTF